MAFKFLASGKSDKGRVRSSNQDSGYAGNNLFIVADGMGGHAGGDIASALATQRVAKIDDVYPSKVKAVNALSAEMAEANKQLVDTVDSFGYLDGMGTTMDALLFSGSTASIVHIGDSRVYWLRDGVMSQVTKDHTFVQKLIDAGRITPEEALVHPRRNVLMKVLGDSQQEPEFDVHHIEIQPGDRFLLCSDGLCGVVPEPILEENMKVTSLDEATDLLVAEAKEYGAPDNVTVILVEVRESNDNLASQNITWLGSAANEVVISQSGSNKFLQIFSRISFWEAFRKREQFLSENDPGFAKALDEFDGKVRSWKLRGLILFAIIAAIAGASIYGIYSYTQTRFYLGVENGKIAIYQGIKESFAGFGFSKLYEESTIDVVTLPDFQQDLLDRTISADSLEDAREKLQQIIESVDNG
ncbi:MAG: PP2C family protein-serine/threonine phosphatase [Rhodoluna sp.]|jgi:serine/threonine protein phosphatase PrpC